MNQQQLQSVCEQVYRRFPAVAGSAPKLHQRPGDQALLVFSGSGRAPDGRTLPLTVRVVVNSTGKILKMTSSR